MLYRPMGRRMKPPACDVVSVLTNVPRARNRLLTSPACLPESEYCPWNHLEPMFVAKTDLMLLWSGQNRGSDGYGRVGNEWIVRRVRDVGGRCQVAMVRVLVDRRIAGDGGSGSYDRHPSHIVRQDVRFRFGFGAGTPNQDGNHNKQADLRGQKGVQVLRDPAGLARRTYAKKRKSMEGGISVRKNSFRLRSPSAPDDPLLALLVLKSEHLDSARDSRPFRWSRLLTELLLHDSDLDRIGALMARLSSNRSTDDRRDFRLFSFAPSALAGPPSSVSSPSSPRLLGPWLTPESLDALDRARLESCRCSFRSSRLPFDGSRWSLNDEQESTDELRESSSPCTPSWSSSSASCDLRLILRVFPNCRAPECHEPNTARTEARSRMLDAGYCITPGDFHPK
uniref:Uncharacterized protein n=1 Tax=Anopheles farauti TaxID=69004 RepID=A0A182QD90_9DIPT